MLHIIKSTNSIKDAADHASEGDQFILIEQAVISSIQGSFQTWFEQKSKQDWFFLKEDLLARGLSEVDQQTIDYQGFVTLTEQHQTNITWS